MRKFLFVAGIIISCSAFADNDTAQRVTSLDYVTTQIETRQTKFQQKGSDKIMTYTSTLGTPGERDIVSDLGQETDISNTNIPKVSAVNTKIELKQDKNKIGLPANTVLTNTNSAGNPGTKAIYDSSSTYATQSDALIEYDDFHDALVTAINSELQCTDSSCLLYKVFSTDPSIQQSYVPATGTVVQGGTPTPTNPIYPTFYQQGDMILRKVGDYADSYDATTGKITRRVGVKVFDGTEFWHHADNVVWVEMRGSITQDPVISTIAADCRTNYLERLICASLFRAFSTLADLQAYLAAQYAAGTPVTVYYPLATSVEETWPATYNLYIPQGSN